MRQVTFFLLHLFAAITLLMSCTPDQPDAVNRFIQCQTDCTEEAIAVKDQFLNDPTATLDAFYKSVSQASEDEFGRWLTILRDSFFFNGEGTGLSASERAAVQQAMVDSAGPLTINNEIGSYAERLVEELGVLAIMAEEEGGFVPTVSITGTYAYELENEGGAGEIQVSQLDNEAIRYSLSVVGPPPSYNQGMMEGEAWFTDVNTAVITAGDEENPCVIELTFTGEGVEIKTLEGDPASCGFGNRVMADGTYNRTSSDDPFLPAAVNASLNLQGTWVSAEDTKSVIRIDTEKYVEVYNGEEVGSFTYEFFETCPEQCNNIEGMHCLMVKGEFDATCYAIVSLTPERLEMSMVGGTGNTLVYEKMSE